jgi:lipopolysaccharide transport system ATP-binding protein
VAAHLETEILFVDEVLAVGDAEFQRRCLDKMQNVVRDGRTILFVSHNMAAVKSLCQRVVLFDGGRIVRDGPVDGVVDTYLSAGRVASADGVVPADVTRSGTGEARLRRLELSDQTGQPISQLYLGDRLRVAMSFEVAVPISDVVVSVGISSLDGVRAATAYSTAGGAPGWSLQRGMHRVTADIDVVLMPRQFTLDIAIARTSGNEIDYVQHAFDFMALGVARSGVDSYPWDTVHGFVRPQAQWHRDTTAN